MDYKEILRGIYEDAACERPLFDENDKVIAREIVRICVGDCESVGGATDLLGWLAYPDEIEKRNKFTDYILAFLAKSLLPKSNPARKRNLDLTSIPNKRIKQFLADSSRIITSRLKAADVLVQKMRSNSDPFKQISLTEAAEHVARTSSIYGNWNDEYLANHASDTVSGFIRRTIWPSKPVIHLALAIHTIGQARGLFNRPMIDWVVTPEVWLLDTLLLAERNRVNLGGMFPHDGSKSEQWVIHEYQLDCYMKQLGLPEGGELPELRKRQKNFKVELAETILFIPSNCSF